MKNFPRLFIMIACVLFIFQTISACDTIQNIYETRNDSELAKTKYRRVIPIPQQGVRCGISTSWRDGRMYYIFHVWPLVGKKEAENAADKSPEFAQQVLKSKAFINSVNDYRFSIPTFTAQFTDSGGFVIMDIEMRDTLRMVDDDGSPMGLEQKSSVGCSRKTYQAITDWEISWRG